MKGRKLYQNGVKYGYKECCIKDFIQHTSPLRTFEQELVCSFTHRAHHYHWCPSMCETCVKRVIDGDYTLKSHIVDMEKRGDETDVEIQFDMGVAKQSMCKYLQRVIKLKKEQLAHFQQLEKTRNE